MNIWQWLVDTLRAYPELALFLALAIGFWIGPKKLAGFGLGNVTATLLAAVAIGQLGIQMPGPIKSTFFLLFLFAVGYGVGPQFFQGLSKDGPKQILFSLVVLALCLLTPYLCALLAGLDVGYAVGLYAGSQTISASIGVATDQINRLGLSPEQAQAYLDAIPVGYAVTYIFGTIGSAIILAQLGPKLIGVDLPAACADYEKQMGGGQTGLDPGVFSAYRRDRSPRVPHRCGERPHGQAGARTVSRTQDLRRTYPSRRTVHRRGQRQCTGARRRRRDFRPAQHARREGRDGRAGSG